MKSFSDLITNRRSIRRFTDELLKPEQVEAILKAGLKSPSSKSSNPWEFIAVEDKADLLELSQCKKMGSKLIAGCALAVVVVADSATSDVWIEDASVASILMQFQAEDLGLGSCWVQIRERLTAENTYAENYVRGALGIPSHLQVLSIVAFGYKDQDRSPFDEEKLQWEKVHIGKY